MGDTKVKFPAREVLDTLLKRHAENKEKVGTINGELGERLRTQYDLNSDFTPFAWGLISKIVYKFKTNELLAREMIRIGRAAFDVAEEHMNRNGHAGDIATMAERAAAPQGSKPADKAPDPAAEQTADNVVNLKKGIKPLADEVKKKAEKTPKAKGDKAPKDSVDALRDTLKADKGSFVAEQAAENAKGDAHIKAVAEGKGPPASTMPDLPPELDRRSKADQPDKAAAGKYRLLS